MPNLTGVRAVKLPVKDLSRSVQWYREVFDYQPYIEFPDAGHGMYASHHESVNSELLRFFAARRAG